MKTIGEKVQQQLREVIEAAVMQAKETGDLSIENMPVINLEVPREKTHGDYATNIAMLLSKQARMAPRKIAEIIADHLPAEGTLIEGMEVAGPGFINFFLGNGWLYEVIQDICQKGDDYGSTHVGAGEKVQIEFVSANPTGPLHMGNARGAAVGSVLANVMQKAGYEVTKEFYINDAGNQIIKFGQSLEARYLQALGQDVPFPEQGYKGQDVIDLMEILAQQEGNSYLEMDSSQRQEALITYALEKKIIAMKEDLHGFGVDYDVWFSEEALHTSGKVMQTLDSLKKKGYVYEKEDAYWFKATAFGEEKDEVVIRSNGVPTYFAADIAYHYDKFERGFDTVINIWGADHHGHVSRMKGGMKAMGVDPDRLEVIIMQLVRLVRDGEQVRMSKRSGEMITLNDLVDEVGKDAARFFFVMRNTDSHLDFDLELAKSQSNENPVYYVQYAHARTHGILQQAYQKEVCMPAFESVDLSCLSAEVELDLIKKMLEFPSEIADAAKNREPHRMARYAQDLAGLFHSFYNNSRVLGEEQTIRDARLILVHAVQIVLRNTLDILGITAPERM